MLPHAMIRANRAPFNVTRDPFHGFFNRVLDNFSNDSDFVADGEGGSRTWLPAVDIYEGDQAFVATADLPGMSKDDIDVSIEDNVLTVSGERKLDQETDSGTFRRIERSYGSFRRSFTLPRGVEAAKVEATFAEGVLTLNIPKSDIAKSRKITIV